MHQNVNTAGLTAGIIVTMLSGCWMTAQAQNSPSPRNLPNVPNVSPNPVAPAPVTEGRVAPEPAGSSVYARSVRSVVYIECQKPGKKVGTGTGSIIMENGLILTNAHVIEGSDRCFAVLKPEGTVSIGKDTPILALHVRAVDPTKDLALVSLVSPPAGLKPLPIGSLKDVEVGQTVHAIGHPRGNLWSYTNGVVSQIREKQQGIPPLVADVVQTQAPISPGNSGGPLISNTGVLVGVNTFMRTDAQNLNFAVAVNEVQAFLQRASRGEHQVTAPSRSAKAENGQAQESEEKCEPRTLEERPSKKVPGKIVVMDIGCTGRANAALLTPDDPEKDRILYVSTRAPERGAEPYYDVRYYINPRSDKVSRSWHDVDSDGRPDFLGIHKDGGWRPVSFVAFTTAIGD